MISLYSAYLYFPGGNPAASVPVPVYSRGSNQLSLLFSDAGATVPLANPALTASDGRLSFYAAPGDYIAPLAGEWFSVPLDVTSVLPVWGDLWIHTQTIPSSVWTINHHFGVRPLVEVLVADEGVQSVVTHPTPSQTVITHGSPVSGEAHLRR